MIETKPRINRPPLTKDTKLSEVEASLLEGLSPEPLPEKEESAPPLVYRPGVLVKPLTSFYQMVGGLVVLGDPVCGQAIIKCAPDCAKSLDELARVNPQVRRALMKLIQGSVLTKVTVAHLPIFMAVMAHHYPNALAALANVFMTKPKEESAPKEESV